MNAWEVNFDGLVGLTHHYAGLSFGNEASTRHRFQVSNPRQAAKQGLLKMKALADAGFPQAVIPPHERPFIPVLRQLGFSGSDEQVLEKVARQAPHWLSSVSSASPMWVANAATIAPSADTLDGKVHLTVANLNNKFHRSLEAHVTESLLKAIAEDRVVEVTNKDFDNILKIFPPSVSESELKEFEKYNADVEGLIKKIKKKK